MSDLPRLHDLFARARDLAPDEQSTFLSEACAGDDVLLTELTSLLASHNQAGDFLETSAVASYEQREGPPKVSEKITTGTITLEPVAGPDIATIRVSGGMPSIVGRSSKADIKLDDKTVSRRHVALARIGEAWFLTDLSSRHGTYLNGFRVDPDDPVPIGVGDLIGVGPWTLRVKAENASTDEVTLVESTA